MTRNQNHLRLNVSTQNVYITVQLYHENMTVVLTNECKLLYFYELTRNVQYIKAYY